MRGRNQSLAQNVNLPIGNGNERRRNDSSALRHHSGGLNDLEKLSEKFRDELVKLIGKRVDFQIGEKPLLSVLEDVKGDYAVFRASEVSEPTLVPFSAFQWIKGHEEKEKK